MEDKQISFDLSEEGVALLGSILESATDLVVPGWTDESDLELSENVQEQIVSTAGAILIELLRLSEEAVDE